MTCYFSEETLIHKTLIAKQPAGFYEFAWRLKGATPEWAGGGEDPDFAPLAPAAPHQCGNDEKNCGLFVCLWCRKAMPWCWGAVGDNELENKLCDNCWDARRVAAGLRTEIKMLEGLKGQSEPIMRLYTDHHKDDFFVAETLEEAKEHAKDDADWCDRCVTSMVQVPDDEILTLRLRATPSDDGEGQTIELGGDCEEVSKTAAEWAAFFSEGDVGAGGTGSGYFFSMTDDEDT